MMDISIDGKDRKFDLDDPQLPDWIEHEAFSSGGYPYDQKLKRKIYEQHLGALQFELVKLQADLQETGRRVIVLFEGRDAAGKGGTINAFRSYMNPRHARTVALTKPF